MSYLASTCGGRLSLTCSKDKTLFILNFDCWLMDKHRKLKSAKKLKGDVLHFSLILLSPTNHPELVYSSLGFNGSPAAKDSYHCQRVCFILIFNLFHSDVSSSSLVKTHNSIVFFLKSLYDSVFYLNTFPPTLLTKTVVQTNKANGICV